MVPWYFTGVSIDLVATRFLGMCIFAYTFFLRTKKKLLLFLTNHKLYSLGWGLCKCWTSRII